MAAMKTHRRPPVADIVVGVLCTVLSLAVFLTLPALTAGDPGAATLIAVSPGSVRWWLFLLGLLAQGVLLTCAGRTPRLSMIGAATLAFAMSWSTPGAAYGISSATVLVLVFRAVVGVPLARLASALVSAGILVALGQTVNGIGGEALKPGGAVIGAMVQALAVIAIPAVLGLLVRSRNEVREARHDEQLARTEQRDAQVQAAVSRERTAMARELHDIAAHHLSGIALMAAVVDRQIDTAPKEAHRGVQQVRAQSTAVLDDLRRLVGLLRDDSEGERSVQTLAAVPELVERADEQGPIALDVRTADGRELGQGIGPLAQLALYRTIQEALTNAVTHAPGAARVVEIDDRDDRFVVVTVTNSSPSVAGTRSSAGGFGLVGMRERAELVGANLRFGPTADGGWQVRASVPRESRESAGRSSRIRPVSTPDVADVVGTT
ncbi:sensor histidine kinase [Nakamurella sp. PAMC28650]|uniref:sensor histidine kinase n=1 Tax=Nakamurella sp. PAMC28650 TaxID=2762325 RepID=UPI00164D0955|nr:histidine kinase [Nakamurella sp. PAMC28650]QNK81940.1 sensor histidine kinase [Nakamurella sp. PAMC28650]